MANSYEDCSWEHGHGIGYFKAFFSTLKRLLLNTDSFFANLSVLGPYWDPALFAIIATILGLLGYELWAEVKDWAIPYAHTPYSLLKSRMYLELDIFVFACRSASYFIATAIVAVVACHLTLERLCPDYQGFRATWRVWFYCGGTEVLKILPFVGSWIPGTWSPILLAIGLAKVHRAEIPVSIAGVLVSAAAGRFVHFVFTVLSSDWRYQMDYGTLLQGLLLYI